MPFNRTKIVATMGPATESKAVLESMIAEGLDIARINFSHGKYELIAQTISNIRQINKEQKVHIGILADLQGPKLRIGEIASGSVMIENGDLLVLTTTECMGTKNRIHIHYPKFPADVREGEIILIDDGKIQLQVTQVQSAQDVLCTVRIGGKVASRKGVNLPNTHITLPCLTEKDLLDLQFAISHQVEWIGLSFVRNVDDIHQLRQIMRDKNYDGRIIAKIEKPEALLQIDAIIQAADGIMVARGDLGVELPMEQVPMHQKSIVQKCIHAGKPVIIATQMMESMITNYTPTRAEVNDVANAVMDGADAVMLSAETSVGAYPIKVIEFMRKIIEQVEEHGAIYNKEKPPVNPGDTFITDNICYNACSLAHQTNARAIISMTNSGYTAFRISSHRPKASVLIFTDNARLLTTLSLVWGVRGFYYNRYESTDQTIEDIKRFIKREGLVQTGDLVINIASMPMKDKGRTNMMKLSYIA
jgi:pyruvate kinase